MRMVETIQAKEWHVTPPLYRGFSGMPAEVALERFADQPFALSCTQLPGDLIYIPGECAWIRLHRFALLRSDCGCLF